jgi:hypothetical protein
MFKRRFRLPSPALVISMVTLSLVLGGTAVAASTATHKDKKADIKLIKKLAPSLSVKHAKTADDATHATNADSATSATSATNATNATNATHATSATSATTATTASVANAIGAVTYVKGNVVAAAANGGSGYSETAQSHATCPSGTIAIGSATHSATAGVEVSEADVFKGVSGKLDSVRAYFDNFNNFIASTNYVVAICAAVNTVNNPSNLAAKAGAQR